MAEKSHADPRKRADELAQRARDEAPANPLGELPPVETDFNRNPLSGLPSVEHDFNRNPLDVPKVGTPSESGSGGSGKGLAVFGVVVILIGIGILVYASQHAPTVSNVLTEEYVLKPGAYNAARFFGWAMIVVGAFAGLAGLLRSNRRD